MYEIETRTLDLTGASYEIGRRLGALVAADPRLKARHTAGVEGFGPAQAAEAAELFDRWCPGLNEELAGLADGLGIPPERLYFCGMTYLVPRCSQVALLPSVTAEGKPLALRSYEFSHEAEDFCLVRTAPAGKYAHLGTSVLRVGRDEGLNEHGLSVTMSSCGFPVGALPYMRAPKRKGLQFWAVVRALLENCRDVDEALDYLEGMPIAYNLNMILLDRSGHAALVETLDGRTAVRRAEPGSDRQMLWATNHAVLPELARIEPQAMAHSLLRYDYIKAQLEGKTGLTRAGMKDMLLSRYPDGLCCHDYPEYFGTTKSMVLSPVDGTVELCWGGRAENGWRTYRVDRPLAEGTQAAGLEFRKAPEGAFVWQPLD